MLKSFLKKGQQLKRVTVYPSDYGLQRMAEEARFGPRGLAVAQADSEDDALQRNGKQKARKRSKESLLNRSERDAILETLNEQSSEAEDMDEDGSQEEDASDSDDEGETDATYSCTAQFLLMRPPPQLASIARSLHFCMITKSSYVGAQI